MKLLFDRNLSRKLVSRLNDIFPESSHVQFHELAEKTDTEIWDFARANDFCIVTQDADLLKEADYMALHPKWFGCYVVQFSGSISLLHSVSEADQLSFF